MPLPQQPSRTTKSVEKSLVPPSLFVCSFLRFPDPHQYSFKPRCNWRPTVCELDSLPKLALPTVSAALVGLDRLKVGVFDRLKASARNCSRSLSCNGKSLNTEKSRL